MSSDVPELPQDPREREILLSLDPPARWGLWGWSVRQKGLLTWENAVDNGSYSSYVRAHFL